MDFEDALSSTFHVVNRGGGSHHRNAPTSTQLDDDNDGGTEPKVPPAPAPPPQPAAEAVPDLMCAYCGEHIDTDVHEYVMRKCGHNMHATCYELTVLNARSACACRAWNVPNDATQARAVGGYAVDPGNDAILRGRVLYLLENEHEAEHDNVGLIQDPFALALERCHAAEHEVLPPLPPSPPRETNTSSLAQPTASGNNAKKRPCVAHKPQCAGDAEVCAHGTGLIARATNGWDGVDDADVQRAIWNWHVYSMPMPFVRVPRMLPSSANGDDVKSTLLFEPLKRMMATLKRGGATHGSNAHHLEQLAHNGATCEQLAVMGVNLAALLEHYSLHAIVHSVAPSWRQLVVLGFRPSMLAHRKAVPLPVLLKPPIQLHARHLLLFPVTYLDLSRTIGLCTTELFALGFTAPLLVRLGMRAVHVAREVMQTHDLLEFWRDTMCLTRSLVTMLCDTAHESECDLARALQKHMYGSMD